MNKTLVVIPTYNERENLPVLVKRLMALPVQVNILVVDDGSPDGTGKLADELAAEIPAVHVLHRTEKTGLVAPISPGSNGPWIAVMNLSSSWTATCPTTRTMCRCSWKQPATRIL
jgi:glycosyltransferase involved in cell wall biosynthesis